MYLYCKYDVLQCCENHALVCVDFEEALGLCES